MTRVNRFKLLVLIPTLTVLAYATAGRWALAQQTRVETAGEKFKSIQVLNDMPAEQMGKVMNMISASLGVNCGYCHASNDGDYEKEGFENKDVARRMMRMTFDLNKAQFGGKPEISCNTCHRGQPLPQADLQLGHTIPQSKSSLRTGSTPTGESIVLRYEKASRAVGGRRKVRSMAIRSMRIEPDGKTAEPEAICIKDGKYAADLLYGTYLVREVFDGSTGMKFGDTSRITLKPDEAEQIKREIDIFLPERLRSTYPELEYGGTSRISGFETHLVFGTTKDGHRERLYFDAVTGLLRRRAASTPTILGDFVYQVDYDDHQLFGGIRLPTTIRYAVPHIGWTRKILDVKVNAPVDDAVFGQPRKRN